MTLEDFMMKKIYTAPTVTFGYSEDVIATSVETEYIPFNVPNNVTGMETPDPTQYNVD